MSLVSSITSFLQRWDKDTHDHWHDKPWKKPKRELLKLFHHARSFDREERALIITLRDKVKIFDSDFPRQIKYATYRCNLSKATAKVNPSALAPLEKLPWDIKMHIFSFLNKFILRELSGVCTDFAQLLENTETTIHLYNQGNYDLAERLF